MRHIKGDVGWMETDWHPGGASTVTWQRVSQSAFLHRVESILDSKVLAPVLSLLRARPYVSGAELARAMSLHDQGLLILTRDCAQRRELGPSPMADGWSPEWSTILARLDALDGTEEALTEEALHSIERAHQQRLRALDLGYIDDDPGADA